MQCVHVQCIALMHKSVSAEVRYLLHIVDVILHFQLDAVTFIIFTTFEFLISVLFRQSLQGPLVADIKGFVEKNSLLFLCFETYFALQLCVTPSIATGL